MADAKIKLEELCKKYQVQLKEANIRIEALEGQQRQIKDDLFS